ncbi:MAG: peptide chain release factor 2 [Spirochaetes bacterium]|nr:peptide chain release factor 2 [Spirochaetota bacterium]
MFDVESLKKNIKGLEEKTLNPDLWQNRKEAESVLSELKRLKDRYEAWKNLYSEFEDFYEIYKISLSESDSSMEEDIRESLKALETRFSQLEILELLGGRQDQASCFLTIHSGAGGTEACDWVSMLFRMYARWAERHRFKMEILSMLDAEGGIKSVTVQITGEYAYGYLKTENGIHRLVRISPFDSSSRRHTSFASVFCSPVISDEIEVEIKPDEIRIDTYRSTGAGGQHVNKTDSAVRITHFPTGIVVQCQNERSQYKNKAMALKILRSRLYDFYEKEQEKKRAEVEKKKKDISWGNQIRSYVFHPYSMIKDHRTNYETGNIQAVMDGAIDDFIKEYLKLKRAVRTNVN